MKRLAISVARTTGHALMWPLERRLMTGAKPLIPPVFIIGAPRSGTSLLYELLITRFRFAYMSNAAHRFFRTPLVATRVFASAIHGWKGNFTSRYGHIEGWGAPNEGGWIWKRWLSDGDWDDGTDISERVITEMRALIAGFSSIEGAPFLNKNVMHSNRLLLMQRIWPDALYIEVQRDILDNARSIVRAERAEGGPEKHQDEWWSVRPRLAKEYVGKSDTSRAVAQVIGVTNDIAKDMAAIGKERLLRIEYNSMCASPDVELARIADCLAKHGCPLKERGEVPANFPVKPSSPLDEADERAMSETLSALAESQSKAHDEHSAN